MAFARLVWHQAVPNEGSCPRHLCTTINASAAWRRNCAEWRELAAAQQELGRACELLARHTAAAGAAAGASPAVPALSKHQAEQCWHLLDKVYEYTDAVRLKELPRRLARLAPKTLKETVDAANALEAATAVKATTNYSIAYWRRLRLQRQRWQQG